MNLKELKANHERTWFEANKKRFINDLKEPALAFIDEFAALCGAGPPLVEFICDALEQSF